MRQTGMQERIHIYEENSYDRRRYCRSCHSNIALMPALKEAGYDIEYIGSVNGMEKGLIEAQKIPYHGISSGKAAPIL